jgi:hypothetical protein
MKEDSSGGAKIEHADANNRSSTLKMHENLK